MKNTAERSRHQWPYSDSQIYQNSNTAGAGQTVEIWEKLDAAGSETSFQYTSSNSQKSMNRVFMVSGSHTTQAMEAATFTQGASVSPDSGTVTASWGSDDNLYAPFELPNLTAIFLATVNGQHMKSFDVRRVMLKRFGHLNGQFTSGSERQDLNVFVLHFDAGE